MPKKFSTWYSQRITSRRKCWSQRKVVPLPRPPMPTAQEIQKVQEAHLHTAQLAKPVVKTK